MRVVASLRWCFIHETTVYSSSIREGSWWEVYTFGVVIEEFSESGDEHKGRSALIEMRNKKCVKVVIT